MISDWVPVAAVQARWTGSTALFQDAIVALHSATCQQEVVAALKPPIFHVSPMRYIRDSLGQPLIVWRLAAGGVPMLFDTLTELRYSADVKIVP